MGKISGPKKIGVPRRICDQGTGSGPSFVHSATVSNAGESAEYVHPWPIYRRFSPIGLKAMPHVTISSTFHR